MSRFVLHASATLVWCFKDESVDWIDFAPRHWALEIANAFLMALRRGRMKRDELDRALRVLLALPIHTDLIADAVLFDKIPILAEQYALTAYDAAYREFAICA